MIERPPAPEAAPLETPAPARTLERSRRRERSRRTWVDELYERLRPLRTLAEGIGLIEILAMAFAVRGIWILAAGFPLNDGGLFYVFAQDIQEAGYRLPEFSSYNDGTIPLAYPPLAFYMAALLDDLTQLSLLDVIWLAPLVESTAVVGAFYLLASQIVKERWAVVLGSVAFLLAPRSFLWLVMGGGLTRGLALALALLAIHQARRACLEDGGRAPAIRSAVFLGLSVLTTLETAAWAVFSLPLFTILPFESRASFLRRTRTLIGVGLGAGVVVLPWFLVVVSYHGLDPFMAAREYGGATIGTMDFELMWENVSNPVWTGEPYFPLIAALGLLGAVYALVRGDWLLPAWWVLTVVMGTRAFPTLATVSIAMLAGVALHSVIGPAFLRAGAGLAGVTRERRLAVAGVGAVALLFTVAASLEDSYGDQRYLRPLTTDERAAMEWISEETPEDAKFLVISRNGWYADRDGEWFPALAERENVATVQGYEWVAGEFQRRAQLQVMAQTCLPGEGHCLGELSDLEDFDYVYVPETCCDWLRELIDAEWRYAPIFDNGATVFQRVTGPVRPTEIGIERAPFSRSVIVPQSRVVDEADLPRRWSG